MQLVSLPPYSPELNPVEPLWDHLRENYLPIEPCWGKVKQKRRSLKARTVDTLQEAISQAIATITPDNASAWFAHCGYDLQ